MALSVPQNLQVGQTIELEVTGSSHAGETIEVTVKNEEGDEQQIPVTLDMEGNGQGTWTVPPWDSAKFSYSTCKDEVRTPTFQMA